MAEHRKGQDRSGQEEEKIKGSPTQREGNTDAGSRHQTSINRGMVDMDPGPSIGTKRHTRGSGISTKKNVTGSDYDGQLSDE